MTVVTIRGQLGSGAQEIGRLVAQQLGADYVDREIIASVAGMLERQHEEVAAKESPPSGFMGRLFESLSGLGVSGHPWEGVYLPTWKISLDDRRYLASLTTVIEELAARPSIVIVGRGSQFILENVPGSVHVLTVAPIDIRLKRIMSEHQLGEKAAARLIERSDESRKSFTRRYFSADWHDPAHYHLVISTAHLSYEDAVSLILRVAKRGVE